MQSENDATSRSPHEASRRRQLGDGAQAKIMAHGFESRKPRSNKVTRRVLRWQPDLQRRQQGQRQHGGQR
eukprot:5963587-Pyramimonas_sp.AAC.1